MGLVIDNDEDINGGDAVEWLVTLSRRREVISDD